MVRGAVGKMWDWAGKGVEDANVETAVSWGEVSA